MHFDYDELSRKKANFEAIIKSIKKTLIHVSIEIFYRQLIKNFTALFGKERIRLNG